MPDPTPELKFCGLCGKNKPAETFHRIPLAMLSTGVAFIYEVCEGCNKVVFNIRRIVGEADALAQKNLQTLKEAKEQGRIILPGRS